MKLRTPRMLVVGCMAVGSCVLVLANVSPASAAAHSSIASYNLPDGAVNVASATATVVLPSFTCPKNSKKYSYDIGFETSSNTSAGGPGTDINMRCNHKVPSYGFSVWVGFTSGVPFTPNAGDTVDLNLTCDASGSTMNLDDVTLNMTSSASAAEPTSCGNGGFDVGGSMDSPKMILPSFGPIDFSDVTVNGSPYGNFSPFAWDTSSGKKFAVELGPFTSSGTAFTLTKG